MAAMHWTVSVIFGDAHGVQSPRRSNEHAAISSSIHDHPHWEDSQTWFQIRSFVRMLTCLETGCVLQPTCIFNGGAILTRGWGVMVWYFPLKSYYKRRSSSSQRCLGVEETWSYCPHFQMRLRQRQSQGPFTGG